MPAFIAVRKILKFVHGGQGVNQVYFKILIFLSLWLKKFFT
jgi:hypothetical protein